MCGMCVVYGGAALARSSPSSHDEAELGCAWSESGEWEREKKLGGERRLVTPNLM